MKGCNLMGDFFYDVLIRKLNPFLKGKKNALDIGCGYGWLTRELAKENLNVLGFDIDEISINKCKEEAEKQGLGIIYDVKNIENLSENNYFDKFDLITCHNVLGYTEDPLREIIKLATWLKSDGFLSLVLRNPASRVIESYVRDKNIEFAEQRINQDYFRDKSFGVCRMYYDKQIKDWIYEADLSVEAFYGLSTFYDITENSYYEDEEWKSKALELELTLSEKSPYREIASYWHFVVRKFPKKDK